MIQTVTFQDIVKARGVIAPYLGRTPLHSYPALNRLLDASVYVKHENHHMVGAFKVRGGVNLVATLPEEQKKRGIIGVTRGNHGLSLAFSGALFGVRVVIVVPYGNNPDKNESMRLLGAELIEYGKDYDEAREEAERLTGSHGYRYVHAAEEPLLIAGVGTYALEIFEDLPEPDVIIAPIGLGSGLSGLCTVSEGLGKKTQLIGVQAARADSVVRSWREGRIVTTETADTIADGLATRVPSPYTLGIMRRRVNEMLTVSEEEIAEAVRLWIPATHNLVEPAGATPLAAALKMKDALAGKKVVLVQTGQNITWGTLRGIMDRA